jgi:hypothetical protein
VSKAEDSLISELDGLEGIKGPEPMTCRWWREVDEPTRDAVVRNVKRVTATTVFKHLRAKGHRVTADGLRDHAAGKCGKCQQPTS